MYLLSITDCLIMFPALLNVTKAMFTELLLDYNLSISDRNYGQTTWFIKQNYHMKNLQQVCQPQQLFTTSYDLLKRQDVLLLI